LRGLLVVLIRCQALEAVKVPAAIDCGYTNRGAFTCCSILTNDSSV
jgi:hypothetical protein